MFCVLVIERKRGRYNFYYISPSFFIKGVKPFSVNPLGSFIDIETERVKTLFRGGVTLYL